MATGHILENLVKIQQAIDAINITLYNLRAAVDSLIANTGIKLTQKASKSRSNKAKHPSLNNQAYQHQKDLRSLAHSVGLSIIAQ
jgi:FtsZ-binding cell division protein ZapB